MFKKFLVRQKYFYKILGGDYNYMFNIQKKYEGPGVYRFLDSQAKTIYIGKSKNVHRRLFSQHFKKSGAYGHLPAECYKATCKIEIIKCKDHAQAVAMEQYLIDKYVPKYNKADKRKDIFNNSFFEDQDRYEQLEKWKLYYTFREFDFNKIELSKKQTRLSLVATYICFIAIIGGLLWTLF